MANVLASLFQNLEKKQDWQTGDKDVRVEEICESLLKWVQSVKIFVFHGIPSREQDDLSHRCQPTSLQAPLELVGYTVPWYRHGDYAEAQVYGRPSP